MHSAGHRCSTERVKSLCTPKVESHQWNQQLQRSRVQRLSERSVLDRLCLKQAAQLQPAKNGLEGLVAIKRFPIGFECQADGVAGGEARFHVRASEPGLREKQARTYTPVLPIVTCSRPLATPCARVPALARRFPFAHRLTETALRQSRFSGPEAALKTSLPTAWRCLRHEGRWHRLWPGSRSRQSSGERFTAAPPPGGTFLGPDRHRAFSIITGSATVSGHVEERDGQKFNRWRSLLPKAIGEEKWNAGSSSWNPPPCVAGLRARLCSNIRASV